MAAGLCLPPPSGAAGRAGLNRPDPPTSWEKVSGDTFPNTFYIQRAPEQAAALSDPSAPAQEDHFLFHIATGLHSK